MALLGGSALLRTNFMVDLKINSGTKKKEEGKCSRLWCVPALLSFRSVDKALETQAVRGLYPGHTGQAGSSPPASELFLPHPPSPTTAKRSVLLLAGSWKAGSMLPQDGCPSGLC